MEKTSVKVGNLKALSNKKVKQKYVLQPDGFGFKAIKELIAYTDLPFLDSQYKQQSTEHFQNFNITNENCFRNGDVSGSFF